MNQIQPIGMGTLENNERTDRAIFCTYWLYFYGFRSILGEVRLFDYFAISLAAFGLIRLMSAGRLNSKLIIWVILLLSPLILAIMFEPNIDTIIFFTKTFIIAIYFVGYFKSMRLSIMEFFCFAVPVVVSVYFFIFPRASDIDHLLKGRMAGISEPNFTSLSLIISMCGAFGAYVLASTRRVKIVAILIVLICFYGVILTASRAGLIGAVIMLCLVLTMEKRLRYAGLIWASILLILALCSTGLFLDEFIIIERFQTLLGGHDLVMSATSERFFTKLAWHTVQTGDWFIAGNAMNISEWGRDYGMSVPHNSLLDLGIAFGKASLYFYGVLTAALLGVNMIFLLVNRQLRNVHDKSSMLPSILFLALFPMYMSLSAGMAMDFVLWLALGAYPLLTLPRQPQAISTNCGIG